MLYVFLNGTARQQSLWQEASRHLMHLPPASYPLRIEVTFETPEELDPPPEVPNDFAITEWEYGSPNLKTFVRDDAPGFGSLMMPTMALAGRMGLKWSTERFYLETAAHELGHSLFAALPEEFRLAIAALFGANTDDPSVLQPEGAPWETHIAEGIAETFKEAFLPRKYRVFPNRTRRRIPYHKYPRFRRLFREGCAYIENTAGAVGESGSEGEEEGEGGLGEGEEAVPAYDIADLFKEGGYEETGTFKSPFDPEGPDVGDNLIGEGGFYDTRLWWEAGLLEAEFRWEGWVKEGTVLTWELPLNTAPFLEGGGDVHLEIFRPLGANFFNGTWLYAKETGKYTLEGDAKGFEPPTTVKGSIEVLQGFFGTVRKCGGHNYLWVELGGKVEVSVGGEREASEHAALREAQLYSWLAPFPFSQSSCGLGEMVVGTEPGVPDGRAAPGGVRGGRVHTRGRVVGARA